MLLHHIQNFRFPSPSPLFAGAVHRKRFKSPALPAASDQALLSGFS
jgi:hypothetical protein